LGLKILNLEVLDRIVSIPIIAFTLQYQSEKFKGEAGVNELVVTFSEITKFEKLEDSEISIL